MKNISLVFIIILMLIPNVGIAVNNWENIEEDNTWTEDDEVEELRENYIEDNVDYINVKIGKSYGVMERIQLESEDDFNLYERDSGEHILTIEDKTIYIATKDRDNIYIYNEDNEEISILPTKGEVILGSGIKGKNIKVNNREYRDYLSFIKTTNGLNVINRIDMEKYLYGVLPREIPASGGMEALKAQGVTARSYAYRTLGKHRAEGYDLCDTTHCQVYGGYSNEHPRTNQAVNETKGLIASYDGQIASTFFHSSSGGYTESSENVWGGKAPYLVGVRDPYSDNAPNSYWEVNLSIEELVRTFKEKGIKIDKIEDIVIDGKTRSGRVTTMSIIGEGRVEKIKSTDFRTMFGNTKIKSTLFNIELEKQKISLEDGSAYPKIDKSNKYNFKDDVKHEFDKEGNPSVEILEDPISTVFTSAYTPYPPIETIEVIKNLKIYGSGYGHGIGMSQYGAVEMAKQGFSFEEILDHYYKGVRVTHKSLIESP